LKDRNPEPIDERAAAVGREVLEPSSAVLQTAAKPSQLPAQTKKARHLAMPGLQEHTREVTQASQSQWIDGQRGRLRGITLAGYLFKLAT
jgi:hypothetical protein